MTNSQCKRAIGYSRVSTNEQVKEGVSLEAQEERIRAYCIAKGWEFTGMVQDPGISGKDLKRPGLQSILEACMKREKTFDVIVVTKLDRITRSVADLAHLNKLFRDNKIGFTSIQENVDTTSATGELFHNIVASISQWERRIIGERTKEALQHKKSNGQRVGGFELSEGGKTLFPVPEEQTTLIKIQSLRENGKSYNRIAQYLNEEDISTKKGKQWYASTVYGILKTA